MMRIAIVLLFCLSQQSCIGWAHRYVAEHPDGIQGPVCDPCRTVILE